MNRQRVTDAIRAAFIADAYCLGAHWIYDGKELSALDMDWGELNAPQAHWHKGKVKGDFTHYGDHGRWLYEFIRDSRTFHLPAWRDYWFAKMQHYTGYVDASSRETVEVLSSNPEALTGSSSQDLSIIGRIAPLLLVSDSLTGFQQHVQEFVALTHNSRRVLKAAEWFAGLLHAIVEGKAVREALSEASIDPDLKPAFDAAMASAGEDSFRTIRAFGPACGIDGGFEGTIHLLVSYDTFRDAMVANARAGGDSAARGMVTGMLLGAAGKVPPAGWSAGVNLDFIEQE